MSVALTMPQALEIRRHASADTEILDVQTGAELQSILDEVRHSLSPSRCSEWNEDDARVAAVLVFPTQKELWVGEKYSESEGLGVEGLQRTYEIRSFSIGGSPLEGSIILRLRTTEMDVERACFEKLKGVQVRLEGNHGEETYQEIPWSMTVDKVIFGILVESGGIWKDNLATGES